MNLRNNVANTDTKCTQKERKKKEKRKKEKKMKGFFFFFFASRARGIHLRCTAA